MAVVFRFYHSGLLVGKVGRLDLEFFLLGEVRA